jgi:hypothetical protein
MRAKEFIIESGEGSIQDTVADALPATFVLPSLQNQDPYKQYRYGVALAQARGSKKADVPDFEPRTAWGENAIVVAYDNESQEMIKQAADAVSAGAVNMISTPKSQESKNVNKTSAVAKPKRNKYGV